MAKPYLEQDVKFSRTLVACRGLRESRAHWRSPPGTHWMRQPPAEDHQAGPSAGVGEWPGSGPGSPGWVLMRFPRCRSEQSPVDLELSPADLELSPAARDIRRASAQRDPAFLVAQGAAHLHCWFSLNWVPFWV